MLGDVRFVLKIALWLALAALPCSAQFRFVKVWFSGNDCASCTQSMAERMQRIRGVESASVDAEGGTLEVHLAEQNRVRIEQIRDFIEQDGTKATRAAVRVTGDLSNVDGRWMLRPARVSSAYEVTGPELSAGPRTIIGEVSELHAGTIRIHATESKPVR